MGIWIKLTKKYFFNNNFGTKIDILKWINDNHRKDVIEHIKIDIKHMQLRHNILNFKTTNDYISFIEKRYNNLMKSKSLSVALKKLLKENLIYKIRIEQIVKYRYFKTEINE